MKASLKSQLKVDLSIKELQEKCRNEITTKTQFYSPFFSGSEENMLRQFEFYMMYKVYNLQTVDILLRIISCALRCCVTVVDVRDDKLVIETKFGEGKCLLVLRRGEHFEGLVKKVEKPCYTLPSSGDETENEDQLGEEWEEGEPGMAQLPTHRNFLWLDLKVRPKYFFDNL